MSATARDSRRAFHSLCSIPGPAPREHTPAAAEAFAAKCIARPAQAGRPTARFMVAMRINLLDVRAFHEPAIGGHCSVNALTFGNRRSGSLRMFRQRQSAALCGSWSQCVLRKKLRFP